MGSEGSELGTVAWRCSMCKNTPLRHEHVAVGMLWPCKKKRSTPQKFTPAKVWGQHPTFWLEQFATPKQKICVRSMGCFSHQTHQIQVANLENINILLKHVRYLKTLSWAMATRLPSSSPNIALKKHLHSNRMERDVVTMKLSERPAWQAPVAHSGKHDNIFVL